MTGEGLHARYLGEGAKTVTLIATILNEKVEEKTLNHLS